MLGLVVNADDFGLTRGVNRGILELHRAGIVTSASLMAVSPAADEAIAMAKANPGLGVGCHLNFVEGLPAAHPEEIPTLLGADGKTFRPSLLDFAQALLRGSIRAEEIAIETQAQIQKLQRSGIDVTHVDTHKHTHVFPLIARTVVYIAERCGVMAIRNPVEPRWAAAKASPSLLRRGLLSYLQSSAQSFSSISQIAEREVLTTEGTLGIAGTGSMTSKILRETLKAMPEDGVFEWCCHPGYHDADLDACRTRLRSSREDEIEMLMEVIPEFSQGVRLMHYGQLGVAGLQRASGQFVPYNGYEKVL